jgi:hypothetical protein
MPTIETNSVSAPKNNEIDLMDVLLRLGRGVKKAFVAASVFLIKKSLWLIGFVLIGGSVALLFYGTAHRQYTSVMVAQTNAWPNSYAVDYINQLENSSDSLIYAKVLNIPPSAAKRITSMKAFFGIDTDRDGNADYMDVTNSSRFGLKDTTKRRVPKILYIQAMVSDPSVFPLISEGVTTALKNNPHFMERNKVRITHLEATIAELETQYLRLDSLARFEYFNNERITLRTSGQMLVLNERERRLYHPDLLDIQNRLSGHKGELALYSDPITIIQDFPTLSIVDNPLSSYLRTWILLFLGVGIVFLIIRHHRTKIFMLIKTAK